MPAPSPSDPPPDRPTANPARRTVVVAGWVGSRNLGDELIHRALVRDLIDLGVTPVSVSVDPAQTEAVHGTRAIRVAELPAALGSAHGFVFGGGTIIQQESSLLNNAYHLARLRLALARRVPSVGVGLGVGRLRTPTARRSTIHHLRRLGRLVVRDAHSAQVLTTMGVPGVGVGCDLAFTLDAAPTDPDDVVAVGLRPPPSGGILPARLSRSGPDEAWLAAMAGALDRVTEETGLGVRFVAMDHERDHAVHVAVAERMRASAETRRPTLDDVIATFGAARATIGMRYHAAVASLVAGRPVVGIGYADKVTSLVEDGGGAVVGVGAGVDGISLLAKRLHKVVDRSDRVAALVEAQRARHPVTEEALNILAAR